MRALITLTLAASATLAAAAEVQVPPAVALAADMVESRIVEGLPSARWLLAVSTGLRSGRITIQEASALLALTNGYLVDERNRNFLAHARPELDKGGLVMAIGNFHLPGTAGMVELLRRAGYRVDRVVLPGEVTP